ncbi:MAG: peptidase [Synechococcaceae cyanobacterium]|nr:peptidase [Synechococcaceae cyanobacterium]
MSEPTPVQSRSGSGPGSGRSPRQRGPGAAARLRQLHALMAPLVLAPLLVTAITGMAYRVLRDWGGMGRRATHGLMVIHEGEWLRPLLGESAETLYVVLNGLGLLWMLTSGTMLLWQRLQRRPRDVREGGA